MNPALLLNFIKRESNNNTHKKILLLTVISGLTNALLLALINSSSNKTTHGIFNYKLIIIFVLVFFIFVFTKYWALKLTSYIAEDIVYGVRERIVKYITDAELSEFETLGRAELYTRLTTDTNVISNSAPMIANGVQSLVLVIFAIFYLFILNITACLVSVSLLLLGISNYIFGNKKLQADFSNAISIETSYFEKINEITGGFKEIKINQQKKYDLFYNKIRNISLNFNIAKKSLDKKNAYYSVFAQAFFYVLLGTIVFIVPVFDKDVLTNIAKITSTVLFIIMPLGTAIGAMDSINRASVAVGNLSELEHRFEANMNTNHAEPELEGIFKNIEEISFSDLFFGYKDSSDNNQFSVGPINLKIKKGEIIFIIGGNGSGKSTLLKMITGLYLPEDGYISVDGTEINQDNLQEYRDLFGVIFSDFFLFSELYGIKNPEKSQVVNLIKKMELKEKTGFKDRAFTNLNLSTGQKKRLAMISVILENKDILVFDEWAADQDPEFRKYFYDELLLEFAKQGKAILAITHDDYYYNKADRIYKMDYGKLKEYKV